MTIKILDLKTHFSGWKVDFWSIGAQQDLNILLICSSRPVGSFPWRCSWRSFVCKEEKALTQYSWARFKWLYDILNNRNLFMRCKLTYSWRWESPEGSSWCPRRSSHRCPSQFSLAVSSSAEQRVCKNGMSHFSLFVSMVIAKYFSFWCHTNIKKYKKTLESSFVKIELLTCDISYRPWLQNMVNSEQHQDYESTQEDVHKHPAWEKFSEHKPPLQAYHQKYAWKKQNN